MRLTIVKRKFGYLIILFLISASTFQIYNINNTNITPNQDTQEGIHNSALITKTRQWIKNGNFTSTQYWSSTKGPLGDPTDIDASIGDSVAKYEVLGNLFTFDLINNTPNKYNWDHIPNVDNTSLPDTFTMTDVGLDVFHEWHEDENQTVKAQWDRNINLDVDISDYNITSASLEVCVNATVHGNDGQSGGGSDPDPHGIENIADTPLQISTGDYVEYYVLISTLDKSKEYIVESYRPPHLGRDIDGEFSYLYDTSFIAEDEEELIFFLNKILKEDPDHRNFTITLGIKVFCEDNYGYDKDTFDTLLIKNISLIFTAEKIINQLTSVSWNQEGDIPTAIITNPFEINAAILNFKYNLSDLWPTRSPNSEMIILINGFPHPETVELSDGTITFQNASKNGFDVRSFIIYKDKEINISIKVNLADEFGLNQTLTVSIDEIYLNITYTENVPVILTDFQLFLDHDDKTIERVTELPLAENLNISLRYTNQTGQHIPGATIHLEGKVNNTLDEHPALELYSTIVNTTELGIGVWILTIIAQKTLYETQEIPFFVEVTERDAELQLILMGEPKNDGDTIGVEADEVINITVTFRDNITKNHLPNALITLLGWDQLNETNNQYSISINATDLDKGINAFTIFAQLINYKTQSINFFIEIYEKATEYKLFLNGIDLTLNPLFILTVFENLNVTVKYTDNESIHITNATLQLIGEGLSLDLPENNTLQHYSRIIDTTILGIGVKIFNIIAQKNLYETQNIQFFVEIRERDSKIQLIINDVPQNDGDTITVEIDDTINITVYFRDSIYDTHLPNATITLLGWNRLNETNNQYNITINANDLEQGITVFTIFAQLTNYESQSIQFFIKVVERSTEILLFLNGVDKTNDPVFNLTIGQSLNITVKYIDNQTGYHIPGALVQLEGMGLPITLDRDDILGQHIIILDTRDLGIGVKLFSIVAQANNYEIQTTDPRITVKRISTLINLESGGSLIEKEVGEDVLIKIILNDTVFGGLILNATVTYRWAYGPGELEDPDNNGIYEVTLENLPLGSYPITINAFAGDDYDFETKIINLYVSSPETEGGLDLSWLIYVLIGGIIGLTTIFTLYQTYFKYPPMVRKVRKLRKKIKKGKKTKTLITLKRNDIIENSYKDQSNILESELKLDTTQIKNIEK